MLNSIAQMYLDYFKNNSDNNIINKTALTNNLKIGMEPEKNPSC